MSEHAASVAVIIPAFNAGATIVRTLQSVMAQSLPADEIVVVDDGSTDDTAAQVQAMAVDIPHLRLVSQVNSGPSAARNRAIRMTRSAFIAPVDADDVWHPDYLDLCVNALRANPQAGMTYAWHHLIDMDDRILRGPMPFAIAGAVLGPMLLTNFVGNGSSAVYRRAAIEGAGLYRPPTVQSHSGEDYFLQLRIAARWSVLGIQRDLVGYRKAQGTLSSDCHAGLATRLAAIRLALEEFGPCPLPVERWARGDAGRTFAVHLLQQGQRSRALRVALGALASDAPAFLFDLGLRVRNLALRRMGKGAPIDRPLDRLLLLRLRLLANWLPGTRIVPVAFKSPWSLPQDAGPAFDTADSLRAVVTHPVKP